MGAAEKIKDIEDEMKKTQKNKATEHHIGKLKAKLAKLRRELLEPVGGGKCKCWTKSIAEPGAWALK